MIGFAVGFVLTMALPLLLRALWHRWVDRHGLELPEPIDYAALQQRRDYGR